MNQVSHSYGWGGGGVIFGLLHPCKAATNSYLCITYNMTKYVMDYCRLNLSFSTQFVLQVVFDVVFHMNKTSIKQIAPGNAAISSFNSDTSPSDP